MYSKKSAEPRMEPWGTQTLKGYSCEDFLGLGMMCENLGRPWKARPKGRTVWAGITCAKF